MKSRSTAALLWGAVILFGSAATAEANLYPLYPSTAYTAGYSPYDYYDYSTYYAPSYVSTSYYAPATYSAYYSGSDCCGVTYAASAYAPACAPCGVACAPCSTCDPCACPTNCCPGGNCGPGGCGVADDYATPRDGAPGRGIPSDRGGLQPTPDNGGGRPRTFIEEEYDEPQPRDDFGPARDGLPNDNRNGYDAGGSSGQPDGFAPREPDRPNFDNTSKSRVPDPLDPLPGDFNDELRRRFPAPKNDEESTPSNPRKAGHMPVQSLPSLNLDDKIAGRSIPVRTRLVERTPSPRQAVFANLNSGWVPAPAPRLVSK